MSYNPVGLGSFDCFKEESLAKRVIIRRAYSAVAAESAGVELFTASFVGRILNVWMITSAVGGTPTGAKIQIYKGASTDMLTSEPTCAAAGIQTATGAHTAGLLAVGDVVKTKLYGHSSGTVTGEVYVEVLKLNNDDVL